MIKGFNIGLILCITLILTGCKTVQHLATAKNENLRIDQMESIDDHPLEVMVSEYREEVDAEMNEVIGINANDLVKGKVNSSMGNFVADLLLSESIKHTGLDVDFAVQNYGGIRINELPKGEITKGKIFELMPFDNLLVVVEMSGKDVINLCNRIADYGGWPVSEGLTFKMGNGIAEDIMVRGKPLKDDMNYLVALPDYVANGGDTCPFMIGLPQTNTAMYIRYLLIFGIEEITANGQNVEHNPSIRIIK